MPHLARRLRDRFLGTLSSQHAALAHATRPVTEQLEARRLLAAATFDTGSAFAGGDSDLAYDDAGTLHLAYYNSADENLKYASRDDGGEWTEVVTLDDGQYAGLYTDVATDGDRVAVSYFDGWAGDLKVALFDGIEWITRTLDTGSAGTEVTGMYTSAAFGTVGELFVSYYDMTAGDLRLAELSPDGDVTLSTLDAEGDVGRHSSIVVNSDTNEWVVAYEATDAGEVRVMQEADAGAFAVADESPEGASFISLALNPSPHKQPTLAYRHGDDLHSAERHYDGRS